MASINRRISWFLPFILAACAAPGQVKPPEVTLPQPTQKDGVSVVVEGLLFAGYDVGGVRGVAINIGAKDLQLVSLSFDLLQADGTKIGDAIANTTGLSAGQRWAFQAVAITATKRPFSRVGPPRITVLPAK